MNLPWCDACLRYHEPFTGVCRRVVPRPEGPAKPLPDPVMETLKRIEIKLDMLIREAELPTWDLEDGGS